MQKLPLSVVIITYNEEKNIGRTLAAVQDIASEIVVVDSYSTDQTVKIAQDYGAKVYQSSWLGFGKQKNLALSFASQEWLLFLDADEEVSPLLKKNIIECIQAGAPIAGLVNRKVFYINKFLNYTWRPDWQLRFVHRDLHPRWTDKEVHETLTIEEGARRKIKKLKGDLYHYTYKDLEDHYYRSLRYAKLGALELQQKGKPFHLYKLILNPLWAFIKNYFLNLGFLDGIRGLSIGFSYFSYTFFKYMYLWEIYNSAKKELNNLNTEKQQV